MNKTIKSLLGWLKEVCVEFLYIEFDIKKYYIYVHR